MLFDWIKSSIICGIFWQIRQLRMDKIQGWFLSHCNRLLNHISFTPPFHWLSINATYIMTETVEHNYSPLSYSQMWVSWAVFLTLRHPSTRQVLSIHPNTDDDKSSSSKVDFVCDINMRDVASAVLAVASCVLSFPETLAAEADKPMQGFIFHPAPGIRSVLLLMWWESMFSGAMVLSRYHTHTYTHTEFGALVNVLGCDLSTSLSRGSSRGEPWPKTHTMMNWLSWTFETCTCTEVIFTP